MREALELEERILRALVPVAPEAWLELDLTMPQLKILIELAHLSVARVGQLAQALNTGAPTASGIVDRLVQRGLVARREDEHDRRVTLVSLTDTGVRAVERLFAASRDELKALLVGFDERELRTIVRALRHLAGAAQRRAVSAREGLS